MTPADRPSWRLLAAIVQIAAFLAFALPGLAHAHGGGHRASHDHTTGPAAMLLGAHDAAAKRLPDQASLHDVAAVAAFAPDDRAGCSDQAPCCVGCCCHAFIPGPDAAAPPARAVARAPAPPAEVSYADLTPEALPEPPRPFA